MSQVSIVSELDQKIQRAKEGLFTGILAIGTDTATDPDVEWLLYFLVGQIVWANARTHPKRRWHRQFLKHTSTYDPKTTKAALHQARNYKTVAQLVMHQKFSREQFSQIVRGCISEVLFDIIHRATLESQTSKAKLIYKASPRKGADFPCIGLQRTHIWEQVQQEWQAWNQANLIDYYPNLAPAVVQSDILQERTSPDIFQLLNKIANGQQTLRDLAVKTKHPLVTLTQALVPHIRRDLIKLMPVDDLPPSNRLKLKQHAIAKVSFNGKHSTSRTTPLKVVTPTPQAFKQQENLPRTVSHYPVVVYVDDNLADSQTMADIFQASGYRYVNISDPLKALTTLLELKPQLIFLDLVMPVVNGYELCAQIRRISAFETVPIIIMTNSSGIPDRVRAKLVGATGFLGKPIKAAQVLKVAIKYLQPMPVSQPGPTRFHRLSASV